MIRRTLRLFVLAAGLAAPGAALAAATAAVVTNDLNIRTGPAANYQRYGTIPAGDEVLVYGCLTGYNWCDVAWEGERGWVHGAYLAYGGRHHDREPIPEIAVRIGVPVTGFDPYDYHRRYYTGRSWYRDRYLDRRDSPRDRDFDRDRDFSRDRRNEARDFARERREALRARRGDFDAGDNPNDVLDVPDDGLDAPNDSRDGLNGFDRRDRAFGDNNRFDPRRGGRFPPPQFDE